MATSTIFGTTELIDVFFDVYPSSYSYVGYTYLILQIDHNRSLLGSYNNECLFFYLQKFGIFLKFFIVLSRFSVNF